SLLSLWKIKKKVLSSLVPGTGQIRLVWKKKKKVLPIPKGQLEALNIVQSTYSLEGESHKVTLVFDVFGGRRGEFEVTYPESYEFTFLKGENLQQIPTPLKKGKKYTIKIRLKKPIQRSYTFQFQLERSFLKLPERTSPPLIEVVNARQTRGYFVLYSQGEAEAIPLAYDGLVRTSFDAISKWVSQSSPYVFFYTQKGTQKKPLRPLYQLKRKQPEIEPHYGLMAYVDENQIGFKARIHLKIRKAKLLSFWVILPLGYEEPYITSRNGNMERVKEDPKGRGIIYEVVLNQGQRERALVEMEGKRKYPVQCAIGAKLKGKKWETHLATCPYCKEWKEFKDTKVLSMPYILIPKGIQPRGVLSLATRNKYNLFIQSKDGLIQENLRGDELALVPSLPTGYQTYSQFRILKPHYKLKCKLVPKKPKVFITQNSLVSLKEGLFRVSHYLKLQVFDAPITELHFHLPKGYTKDDVRFDGKWIRAFQPPKKKEKFWTLSFQKEILGSYSLLIAYEKQIPNLPVGKLSPLPKVSMYVVEGKYYPSYIAVSKEDQVNLYFAEQNLQLTDVRNLPHFMQKEKPFQSYRLLDRKFRLEIQALKREYAPVLNAIVEHFHLDSAMGQDGTLQSQFFLVLKNNGRQYLPIQLPKGYTSLLLQVNGKPVLRPPKGKDEAREVLVPLLSSRRRKESTSLQTIYIRGRYTLEYPKFSYLFGSLKLVPPGVRDVPITLYTWNLYLPKSYTYLDFGDDFIYQKSYENPLLRLRRTLEGTGRYFVSKRGVINELKSHFRSGFFKDIVLHGQLKELYLPGPKASGPIPSLKVPYLGKKTAAFLYLLIFLTVLMGVYFLGNILPISKFYLVFSLAGFLLFISLFFSHGWQSFFLAAFIALAVISLYWIAMFAREVHAMSQKKGE
ncbi:MAG: hypothetical protein D6785_15105, partial [Planctomycetota bacterium]